MTMAKRPVRPALAQPRVLAKRASGSVRKSYHRSIVSNGARKIFSRGGTHNIIILNIVRLSPGAHDERIVGGDDCDNLHTLLLQLGKVLDVAGDMVDGAGGGEGTYYDVLLVGCLFEEK